MHKKPREKSRYPVRIFAAVFIMCIAAAASLMWVSEAEAIRLSMKRIIFEGPKRSDVITIMNNTAKEQTYRLGWRHYRMDEQKSLVLVKEEDVDSSEVKWADDMIRYAPRRVTVPAGGSQQIRVLLRRPRDLEQGEYRSHLWVVTEASAEDFEPQERTGKQAFRLTMQPALTMPIFVRHGELEASARITDASLARADEGGNVNFVLHRSGDRSLYGDLKVICTAGGDEYVASHIRGIAVYTEIDKRIFDYEFRYPPEQANNCRQVRIEYVADKDDSLYSGQVMATATATLN